MAAGAVGVLAVLGELFADGEVLGAGILIERRHVVGRRWGRIVEDHLDDPRAAGDGMRAVGAVVHAEHGGAGDDAAVARVIDGLAGERFSTQLVAHLIIELLPRGLLHLTDVFLGRQFLQDLAGLLQRGVHGGVLFLLVRVHRLQRIGLGNEQVVARSGGGHFLGSERTVVQARLVDGNIQETIAAGGFVTQAEDDGGLVFRKGGAVAAEGFAVRHAVAVAQGRAVLEINHRKMDELVDGGLGCGVGEIQRARKAVAAGDPVTVLAFAQHDGVEEIARTLRAHHAAAALVEVGSGKPYLQRFGF